MPTLIIYAEIKDKKVSQKNNKINILYLEVQQFGIGAAFFIFI